MGSAILRRSKLEPNIAFTFVMIKSVYINYEKTEDPDVDPGVTDEIQQKIDDAVNKAFGDMGSGDSSGYSDNTYSHNTIIGGACGVTRMA